MAEQAPPKVFVSYAHADPAEEALAGTIAARLREHGATVFIDQGHQTISSNRRDAYNLNQAKIAIGAGGLGGQGLFGGTQTRLGVVPEQHTDFIFTAVGEELGFAGASTLLALLALIVWRVWRAAQLSRDRFGNLPLDQLDEIDACLKATNE